MVIQKREKDSFCFPKRIISPSPRHIKIEQTKNDSLKVRLTVCRDPEEVEVEAAALAAVLAAEAMAEAPEEALMEDLVAATTVDLEARRAEAIITEAPSLAGDFIDQDDITTAEAADAWADFWDCFSSL